MAENNIFISHKSEHKPWVEWLAKALKASGRSVFLDIWDLIPGENWIEGLHRGVQNCRSAILVATPEVVNSGWVRDEYNALKSRQNAEPGFRIIPIAFGPLPSLPFLNNLQAVDFRDPARYKESFHKLLRGLDGLPPGEHAELPFAIEPPPPLRIADTRPIVPGEEKFVQRIMARLMRPGAPPLMITARGQRHQGPVITTLLKNARASFGEAGLLHIVPPLSEHIGHDGFFREMGRQCGLPQDTADAVAFSAHLESRLKATDSLMLLVTAFENASQQHRGELAGALRTLSDRHPNRLCMALLGGKRLIEQKYATGTLSILSNASVEEWPDPVQADVLAWQHSAHPETPIGAEEVVQLLAETGGHAGLIRHCLERREAETGESAWGDWSYTCPELWESWQQLAREQPESLRAGLQRDTFGPAIPWPADATARRLYWADVLKPHGRQLVWRTEAIRQVGREVLG